MDVAWFEKRGGKHMHCPKQRSIFNPILFFFEQGLGELLKSWKIVDLCKVCPCGQCVEQMWGTQVFLRLKSEHLEKNGTCQSVFIRNDAGSIARDLSQMVLLKCTDITVGNSRRIAWPLAHEPLLIFQSVSFELCSFRDILKTQRDYDKMASNQGHRDFDQCRVRVM